MTSPVLHAHTDKQIQDFKKKPSHAVLLHGPQGTGKLTVARSLAAGVLDLDLSGLSNYAYLHRIDAPAVSSDAIESVRKLEHFLSLRVPLPGSFNRIVIINDAQALSTQAQNALLKTIEEPPVDTLVILTATNESAILPTIRSRVQSIAVKRPHRSDLSDHFKAKGKTTAEIDQVYAISGGLPGLMAALLTAEDHPLRGATVSARELLQGSMYDRLVLSEELTKDRTHFLNVLYILQQMAHSRLQTTADSQFMRWQQILKVSYEASEQLSASAQPKLVVDALMLKLN